MGQTGDPRAPAVWAHCICEQSQIQSVERLRVSAGLERSGLFHGYLSSPKSRPLDDSGLCPD